MPKLQFAGISITAPDSYVDRSVYAVAANTPQNIFQRNLTLTFQPRRGLDAQQIIREVEHQLLQMRLPALRFGAKGPVHVGGRDGAAIEYAADDMSPDGPIRLVRRAVFVPIDDERVLVMTFTATESDFATHVAELDSMLASVQI